MADSFPVGKQAEHNWCWAAVGASVNQYFSPGSTLQQCQLATEVLDDSRCCDNPLPHELDHAAYLQQVLGDISALKEIKTDTVLTFKEVREQINASFPVCVRIGWPGQHRGHFVVICGFAVSASGEQWLDIADPFFGNGEILTVPYNYFVYSYQGTGRWTDTFLVKQP